MVEVAGRYLVCPALADRYRMGQQRVQKFPSDMRQISEYPSLAVLGASTSANAITNLMLKLVPPVGNRRVVPTFVSEASKPWVMTRVDSRDNFSVFVTRNKANALR